MKTTRKTTYGSYDEYSDARYPVAAYASFHKGSKVYGYHHDELIYGTCTGGRRGDAWWGETSEAEIELKDGTRIWINEDAFANVE